MKTKYLLIYILLFSCSSNSMSIEDQIIVNENFGISLKIPEEFKYQVETTRDLLYAYHIDSVEYPDITFRIGNNDIAFTSDTSQVIEQLEYLIKNNYNIIGNIDKGYAIENDRFIYRFYFTHSVKDTEYFKAYTVFFNSDYAIKLNFECLKQNISKYLKLYQSIENSFSFTKKSFADIQLSRKNENKSFKIVKERFWQESPSVIYEFYPPDTSFYVKYKYEKNGILSSKETTLNDTSLYQATGDCYYYDSYGNLESVSHFNKTGEFIKQIKYYANGNIKSISSNILRPDIIYDKLGKEYNLNFNFNNCIRFSGPDNSLIANSANLIYIDIPGFKSDELVLKWINGNIYTVDKEKNKYQVVPKNDGHALLIVKFQIENEYIELGKYSFKVLKK